jgi:hypothetical protein
MNIDLTTSVMGLKTQNFTVSVNGLGWVVVLISSISGGLIRAICFAQTL